MGKSLIRMVETIKEELTGWFITDDLKPDDEYIVDKINDARATLIRQELRRGFINLDYYQELCCIEVTCEEKGCYIGDTFIKSGTVIWTAEIPNLMLGVGEKSILALGNDNMLTGYGDDNVFHKVTTNNFMMFRGQRLLSDKKTWTRLGNKLFFKNLPQDTRFICGHVLLYNPTSACNWDDDTSDYPVPSESTVQLLVLRSLAGSLPIPGNELNDAREVVVPQQNAQQLEKNVNNQLKDEQ